MERGKHFSMIRSFHLADCFGGECLRRYLKPGSLEQNRDAAFPNDRDCVMPREQRSDGLDDRSNYEVSCSAAFLGDDGLIVLETQQQHRKT